MTAFRFSRRAESDLIEIARYTLVRWGREQAVRYIDGLEEGCQKLVDNPDLGRPCDDIRPGLRRWSMAGIVLVFCIVFPMR